MKDMKVEKVHMCGCMHTQMQVMIAERELCWGRKVPRKSGEGEGKGDERNKHCVPYLTYEA